ncbi:MAG: type transport system ATP-binding protein [Solirubrobacterales bacterium]|jgi:ABC-2 type transport system ATP-binding protein|nr:type transport system ATP-binding protein [Solirubrobacterales bacterium]
MSKDAIEIEGLSKRFGKTQAVHELSFTVPEGTVVGFLGPNGAGKTTTLRALLGLIKPDSGKTLIEGQHFTEVPNPAVTVGAVLEVGGAHAGRSGRNHLRALAMAAGIPRSRVEEVLDLVDLTGAADRRTKGYSLGMKQRLGLAAALLGNPRVLILDEPANGLDPAGIRWLRDLLRSLADQGHTVLVSSHVLAEIANTADYAVVINKGRSVAQAPVAELVAGGDSGIRVASPDIDRLADAIKAAGATVEPIGSGAVVVRGLSAEEIGRAALDQKVVLTELTPTVASLEDAFLQLTGGEEGGPS